jgi:uncharacterized membrane protein
MVLAGILAAVGLIAVDRGGFLPRELLESAWLYNGGGTGARTLLGAVASSTIGVAGTVFSITIAALSLAAGQMGPRLLRNFTRDRGNQITLGAFLGTFSYALMVLRSVRTQSEGEFVPHISLTVGILLAFVCVATLVYFVSHMASRINADTVIELVSDDVSLAIHRLTTNAPQPKPPLGENWEGATVVTDQRHGYLQHLDDEGLANWGVEQAALIRLLIRPGDYVFPGAPIAVVAPDVQGADAAITAATALGPQRTSSADLEFPVRQLVELAVRALSPGINDPHTAMSVLDRLGAALCAIAPVHLPTGMSERGVRIVLIVPTVTYDGLVDTMFHMIRQSASRNPAVLIRLIEVLTKVVSCEHDPERRESLKRHADLALADATREIRNTSDLEDVKKRYVRFVSMERHGLLGQVTAKTARGTF